MSGENPKRRSNVIYPIHFKRNTYYLSDITRQYEE